MMFAARNGNDASAARAFSAPRDRRSGAAALPLARRPEVEVMVADGRGRVTQRVVGGDHRRALVEVRLERP